MLCEKWDPLIWCWYWSVGLAHKLWRIGSKMTRARARAPICYLIALHSSNKLKSYSRPDSSLISRPEIWHYFWTSETWYLVNSKLYRFGEGFHDSQRTYRHPFCILLHFWNPYSISPPLTLQAHHFQIFHRHPHSSCSCHHLPVWALLSLLTFTHLKNPCCCQGNF